jgi:hypothetical protein
VCEQPDGSFKVVLENVRGVLAVYRYEPKKDKLAHVGK